MANLIKGLAAAALATALAAGAVRADTTAGTQPPPASAEDDDLEILELKIKILEIKADVAKAYDQAKSQESKDALQSVMNMLDAIYSMLEDKLQND